MSAEPLLPGVEVELVQSEEGAVKDRKEREELQCRFEVVDRKQLVFGTVDVEQLIGPGHEARAIWEFVGRLDLSRFSEAVKVYEGRRGRAAYDPQLLVSLWVYSYSRGITSGREISRLCEYDPAYQWLTGMKVVNYHSLTDFRVEHGKALGELFASVLAVMSATGLVTLERVMHDGTKIKAQASRHSFRRGKRIAEHLAAAREYVAALEAQEEGEGKQRLKRARERAARERKERLEAAWAEFEDLCAAKPAEDESRLRVSESEPEARKMKHSDGGYAPSYNVQISTDQASGMIVGIGISQGAGDSQELVEAVTRVKENTGQLPGQMVADGAYCTGENINELATQGVDFISPVPDRKAQLKQQGIAENFTAAAFSYDAATNSYTCPARQSLSFKGKEKRGQRTRLRYQATAADCGACLWKSQCCPQSKRGRSVIRWEDEIEINRHRLKMQTTEALEIYKQRAQTAEFPIAWLKEKIGLRRFHVRGLLKAEMEALWASISHNLQQWIRLCWRPQFLTWAN